MFELHRPPRRTEATEVTLFRDNLRAGCLTTCSCEKWCCCPGWMGQVSCLSHSSRRFLPRLKQSLRTFHLTPAFLTRSSGASYSHSCPYPSHLYSSPNHFLHRLHSNAQPQSLPI